MRTEWFIAIAAALLLMVAAVVVVDRTDGEGEGIAVPTPSPSPTVTASPSPDPTGPTSPTPTLTPTPTPSPTVTPSPTTTPTSSPAPPGSAVAPIPSTAVSYGSSGTAFSTAPAMAREADFGEACPVVTAQGETFNECVRAFSRSASAWWVVTTSGTGSDRVVTVWHHVSSRFDAVLRTGPSSTTSAVFRPSWPNHNDVITVQTGTRLEVLVFDTTQPRVGAVLSTAGGSTYRFRAQQVLHIGAAGNNKVVEVLDVPASGGDFVGRRTVLEGLNRRTPEEVALRVYEAWITGNRNAAQPYVNSRVDQALFVEAPNSNDVWSLNGVTCPIRGAAYVCSFTWTGGTMDWMVTSVDGVLRVTDIASQAR